MNITLYAVENRDQVAAYVARQCSGWGPLSSMIVEEIDQFLEFFTLTPAKVSVDYENGTIRTSAARRLINGGVAVQIEGVYWGQAFDPRIAPERRADSVPHVVAEGFVLFTDQPPSASATGCDQMQVPDRRCHPAGEIAREVPG